MTTKSILTELARLIEQQKNFVKVTLLEKSGSVPQNTGAMILVCEKNNVHGTIGGGALEMWAIEKATSMIKERKNSPLCLHLDLNRDLSMACSGTVTLSFEPYHFATWPITIFGAGHVCQALVDHLKDLDCQLTVFDSRQDWLDKLPSVENVTTIKIDSYENDLPTIDPQSFIIVMTYGHKYDQVVLQQLFQMNQYRPYIGVMGSKSKGQTLKQNLIASGIDRSLIDQIHCPIGLNFGNNSPHEIAISIVAQLLEQRDFQNTLSSI